jgi:glycerol-3-phosphate dehydrogenase
MAGALGWDEAQTTKEIEAYQARVDAEVRSQREPDDEAADAVRLAAPEIVPLDR